MRSARRPIASMSPGSSSQLKRSSSSALAGDDVEVEVEHGLPGGRAVRLRDADSGRVEGPSHRVRDPAAGGRDRGEGLVVRLVEVRRVRLGDDEAVALVRGVDVHEREDPVILEQLERRDLARDDPAEDAVRVRVHSWPSVNC